MKVDFDHWQGSQIAQEVMGNLIEERMLNVIKLLNPKFSKDGNQWCYLYGELPNDCIVGFGDTPDKAMRDFVSNFYNQKAINNLELKHNG